MPPRSCGCPGAELRSPGSEAQDSVELTLWYHVTMSEAPQTPRSPDRDAVPDQQPSRVRGGVWRALSLAVVLAAVWLYVWGHADTSLLYHSDRMPEPWSSAHQ